MVIRLDGKAVSAHFKEHIAAEVASFVSQGNRAPHLAAILVGEDGGSKTYIEAKDRACKEVGFYEHHIALSQILLPRNRTVTRK